MTKKNISGGEKGILLFLNEYIQRLNGNNRGDIKDWLNHYHNETALFKRNSPCRCIFLVKCTFAVIDAVTWV